MCINEVSINPQKTTFREFLGWWTYEDLGQRSALGESTEASSPSHISCPKYLFNLAAQVSVIDWIVYGPQIHMLTLLFQRDSIGRWGFRGVIRLRRSTAMNEISALSKANPESPVTFLLPCEDTMRSQLLQPGREFIPQLTITGTLILEF